MKLGLRRRVSRRMLILCVVATSASTAFVAVGPASAATDVATGTITGAGSVSPALTATPTWHQWIFSVSGTVIDVNSSGSGTYTCAFFLQSSVTETIAHGAGFGDGSCQGPLSIDLEGATYVRVGTGIVIEGSAWASNGSDGHFVAPCVYQPDSVPSYFSYHVTCSISFEGLI